MIYDSLFENSENQVSTIEKMAVLKDGTGKKFFPITCSTAIYDIDGVSIGQKIEELKGLTKQVQGKLGDVEELASQREVIVANDRAYNKSTVLLYLASLLSDSSVLTNSVVMSSLSGSTSGLPDNIQQAELTLLKHGDKLAVFLTDVATQKQYYTSYTSSSADLTWYVYLSQPVGLDANKQFVSKEYVDKLVSPIHGAVLKEANKYTDTAVENAKNSVLATTTEQINKVRAEIIATIDQFVKDSITNNSTAYVTKGYLEEQLQKFKDTIGSATDDTIVKRVGDLDKLETTAKDSLVSAVNEVFQSGNNFKAGIKDAVIAKDSTITIPDNPTLEDLVSAIGDMESGVDTSDATATADELLIGATAYTNTGKIHGTIVKNNYSGKTLTPGRSNIIIPKSYNSDPITIKGDTNLVGTNILSGKSIFGVNGTASGGMKMASGNYYGTVYDRHTKNLNVTIVIPINISFSPSRVFISPATLYISATASESDWVKHICDAFITNGKRFVAYNDSKPSSNTSYVFREIKAEITSYSSVNIVLHVWTEASNASKALTSYGGIRANFTWYAYG